MAFEKWKLIGVACDSGSEVIKCIVPLLLCEKCFRKRFCIQSPVPVLCGVAVLPPREFYMFFFLYCVSHRNQFKDIASEPASKSSLGLTAVTHNSPIFP